MLLPFAITLFLLAFVINFFTSPFQTIVEGILQHFGLFNRPFWFFSGEQVLYQSSKIIALIGLFLAVILIGFLARLVLVDYFLHLAHSFLQRIPFINKLYTALQEMVQTVFTSSSSSFSQVVLVPFPYDQTLCVGLVPTSSLPANPEEAIPIFIPGSPNPTGGFLLKFKLNELIFTDMKVEDALKFVVSGGILCQNLFLENKDAKT